MANVLTRDPKKPAATEAEFPPVRDATPEDNWETLEWRARRFLGMSGGKFLRRWLAGEYAEDPDQPGVLECASLVPFTEAYAREHGLL